jgi:hypothetical protein
MLSIYNCTVLGLAITGVAALGVYALGHRRHGGGSEVLPRRHRYLIRLAGLNMYLTPLHDSWPAEMGRHPAPLARIRAQLRHRAHAAATAQLLFWLMRLWSACHRARSS